MLLTRVLGYVEVVWTPTFPLAKQARLYQVYAKSTEKIQAGNFDGIIHSV